MRVRIAAAACVVASGLFVGGAGVTLAFADPNAGQGGETGGTQADPAAAGPTDPASGTTPGDTPVHGTATEPTSPQTATLVVPGPASTVGGGRNGLPAAEPVATSEPQPSSKHSEPESKPPPQMESQATGEPAAIVTARLADTTTPTTTEAPPPPPVVEPTEKDPPPAKGADDPDDPEHHPGWGWPWCWPSPPDPGQPPVGGSDGGVGPVKPPSGLPKPPPLMQLPLPREVAPQLPVIPVDPVVDAVSGLATAAAELPFAPITLPVIVAPLGTGGAGGPGVAPRPGTPPAPRTSGGPGATGQPPQSAGRPSPPAFGASSGAVPASYRAGYGAYLRTAGLAQVAAVAVPGVTGILLLTGAGGLVGYRQARAGHAVRANGTARFVG